MEDTTVHAFVDRKTGMFTNLHLEAPAKHVRFNFATKKVTISN